MKYKSYVIQYQYVEDDEVRVKAYNKRYAIRKAKRITRQPLYGNITIEDVYEID